MSDITVTAAKVGAVYSDHRSDIFDYIAGETITAGQAVGINSTTGKLYVCDATTSGGLYKFRGIALTGGGSGQAISVLREGAVEGFTLSGNYDSLVYLSETAGALADAAPNGTGTTVIVGRVVPLSDVVASTGYPSKVLHVEVNMLSSTL